MLLEDAIRQHRAAAATARSHSGLRPVGPGNVPRQYERDPHSGQPCTVTT
jgi:hypothetical protein